MDLKNTEKKRALISVYNKNGITEFALDLQRQGFEIVSSGGTAKHLREHGVEDVIDVSAYTGKDPILDHRVVTLHPNIHGGILALETDEHNEELKKYNIPRFHLVCVDVYPVWEALNDPEASVDKVAELTDIGGPTMLRAAAKNHENVIVICNAEDRIKVIEELNRNGDLSLSSRRALASKVFELIARYDASIWKFLEEKNNKQSEVIFLENAKELAYAENKYQNPAYIFSSDNNDPLAMHKFKIISGTPSYISIADGNQILNVLCTLATSFDKWKNKTPYIAVAGKHGNPCGLAIDWEDPLKALNKALYGDPIAVMGGEVIVNFPVTKKIAEAMFKVTGQPIGRKKWGLDILFAPEFSTEAIEMLGKREKRRLLANPALSNPVLSQQEWVYQPVRGGWLKQKAPNFILTPNEVEKWSKDLLNQENGDKLFEDILIAWAPTWKASSNTVGLAKDGMLIALGCGQQDRIACVDLCLDRAKRASHSTKGSVFASDAFFPFARRKDETAPLEGPEILIEAGCIGGVVPGDGKNFEEVLNLFTEKGLYIAFLNKNHRGFAKH